MHEIKVKYGIPKPVNQIKGIPEFKEETETVKLSDFPENDLPSGGMSNRISPSEMFMVQTCKSTRMIWRYGEKIIADMTGLYSFVGRFPWEITMPGIYDVDLTYQGKDMGFVEFEVQ